MWGEDHEGPHYRQIELKQLQNGLIVAGVEVYDKIKSKKKRTWGGFSSQFIMKKLPN